MIGTISTDVPREDNDRDTWKNEDKDREDNDKDEITKGLNKCHIFKYDMIQKVTNSQEAQNEGVSENT